MDSVDKLAAKPGVHAHSIEHKPLSDYTIEELSREIKSRDGVISVMITVDGNKYVPAKMLFESIEEESDDVVDADR